MMAYETGCLCKMAAPLSAKIYSLDTRNTLIQKVCSTRQGVRGLFGAPFHAPVGVRLGHATCHGRLCRPSCRRPRLAGQQPQPAVTGPGRGSERDERQRGPTPEVEALKVERDPSVQQSPRVRTLLATAKQVTISIR